jgi:hypothetical protein
MQPRSRSVSVSAGAIELTLVVWWRVVSPATNDGPAGWFAGTRWPVTVVGFGSRRLTWDHSGSGWPSNWRIGSGKGSCACSSWNPSKILHLHEVQRRLASRPFLHPVSLTGPPLLILTYRALRAVPRGRVLLAPSRFIHNPCPRCGSRKVGYPNGEDGARGSIRGL